MNTQELIKQQVTGNPVVLYMKGNPQFPQCGFSANAVRILNAVESASFLVWMSWLTLKSGKESKSTLIGPQFPNCTLMANLLVARTS